MIRASINRRTSSGASGAAALEILAPTARGCYLRDMLISLTAATASTYGIGRPAVKGITPTTPITSLIEAGSDATAVQTTSALAWGTGPTIPAQFYRQITMPAVIGSFILWTWQNLFIPANTSLVLWNGAANGLVDVSFTTDE